MLRKRLPVGAFLFPSVSGSFSLLHVCTLHRNRKYLYRFKATSALTSVPPTHCGNASGFRLFLSVRPALLPVLSWKPVFPGSGPGPSFGVPIARCCWGPRGRRRWRRRRCCCCRRRRRRRTLGRGCLSGIGDPTPRRHWPTGRRTRCWSWRRRRRTCPCRPRWGTGPGLVWGVPLARGWTLAFETRTALVTAAARVGGLPHSPGLSASHSPFPRGDGCHRYPAFPWRHGRLARSLALGFLPLVPLMSARHNSADHHLAEERAPNSKCFASEQPPIGIRFPPSWIAQRPVSMGADQNLVLSDSSFFAHWRVQVRGDRLMVLIGKQWKWIFFKSWVSTYSIKLDFGFSVNVFNPNYLWDRMHITASVIQFI